MKSINNNQNGAIKGIVFRNAKLSNLNKYLKSKNGVVHIRLTHCEHPGANGGMANMQYRKLKFTNSEYGGIRNFMQKKSKKRSCAIYRQFSQNNSSAMTYNDESMKREELTLSKRKQVTEKSNK